MVDDSIMPASYDSQKNAAAVNVSGDVQTVNYTFAAGAPEEVSIPVGVSVYRDTVNQLGANPTITMNVVI